MLKYTVSLYTSIPFGLKALYRNIIIPQNENERERNTDILLIKHLNGHLPNAHNTIPAAHKTSIGIFKKKGRGGKSAIRLCTPPRSDASNIFLNEVLIQSAFLVHKISIKSMKTFTVNRFHFIPPAECCSNNISIKFITFAYYLTSGK